MAPKKNKIVQRYDVVQAKTINELVRLVNIKTRQGWTAQGGLNYSSDNRSDKDYPYCQAIVRTGSIKTFVASKAKKQDSNDRLF